MTHPMPDIICPKEMQWADGYFHFEYMCAEEYEMHSSYRELK